MRCTGAVIDEARLRLRQGVANRRAIQQVDRAPCRSRGAQVPRTPCGLARGRPAGAMPRHDLCAAGRQQIEEMAARETGGTSDENGTRPRHAGQRGIPGTPPMPPLNGETLPRPASVSEMKRV